MLDFGSNPEVAEIIVQTLQDYGNGFVAVMSELTVDCFGLLQIWWVLLVKYKLRCVYKYTFPLLCRLYQFRTIGILHQTKRKAGNIVGRLGYTDTCKPRRWLITSCVVHKSAQFKLLLTLTSLGNDQWSTFIESIAWIAGLCQ